MADQGYKVEDIHAALFQHYLHQLRHTTGVRYPKAGSGLKHLYALLDQQGLIRQLPQPPLTEAEQWLERYDGYLKQVVGATHNTRDRYKTIVRRFLVSHFGTGVVCWKTLTAEQLSNFVCKDANHRRGHGRKQPGVAIRSLLRFLVFSNEIESGLEAALPRVRQWKHVNLPRHLNTEQIIQLLSYCDDTPTGRRDRAILMLLARLGLRAGEVVQLQLDDIDWHRSQLHVRPLKTYQERCLPLSQEIGNALIDYLRDGRPASTHRHVFLSTKPPFAPFNGPSGIGRVVRRACQRAGLPIELHVSAHSLRHYLPILTMSSNGPLALFFWQPHDVVTI